ncbi:MAG TPA: restriction endonuclease subunit S [Ligilactobacillus acidipiscis]|uniref:Restriction endonuclease subunit S n=1 Tax=Ligilactobacillus acidipiscis TaxID=89059 RepID=A0A921K157_9LACO|nr:restriction endonuclease subunit S [Ligilactobacillus acidipiscis]
MKDKQAKYPQLRFKGFTDPWEEHKLGEITEYIKGFAFKSKDYKKSGYRIIRVSDLGKESIKNSNDSIFTSEEIAIQQKKYKIKQDEIIITTVGSKAEMKESAVGRPIIISESLGYLLNQNLVKIYGKENYSNYFIYSQLLQPRYSDYISMIQRGNANQANIAINDLWKFQILIPEIEEQQKIGSFFKQLDHLITLHQRKLDLLKEQKKGYLQKMFPKNGAKVPELRFAGFADAWEQRNIKEISKVFIGLVTSMTENYRDNGTLLIRNSDIKSGHFEFSKDPIYLDEVFAEKNASRRLKIGDVITVHTGDIGTSAVVGKREEGSIGFATINTRPDKSVLDSDYLSTYFNTTVHKHWAIKMSTGDGRSNYNLYDFNRLIVPLPNIEEQQKIGSFFKQLDNLITLHQRKLEKLQELKKGYLQKMFV